MILVKNCMEKEYFLQCTKLLQKTFNFSRNCLIKDMKIEINLLEWLPHKNVEYLDKIILRYLQLIKYINNF